MMKKTYNTTRKDGLTYEMICKAIDGDETAQSQIFEYYEPYIITLSKIPFYDSSGQLKYKIDEDTYMCLKLKLQEVLLKFKVA